MQDLFQLVRGRERDNRPARDVSPEEVFLSWLMRLPAGADVATAARLEVARLDRAEPLPPGPARLRDLMRQATFAPRKAAQSSQ